MNESLMVIDDLNMHYKHYMHDPAYQFEKMKLKESDS